jgi:hypothetical protein
MAVSCYDVLEGLRSRRRRYSRSSALTRRRLTRGCGRRLRSPPGPPGRQRMGGSCRGGIIAGPPASMFSMASSTVTSGCEIVSGTDRGSRRRGRWEDLAAVEFFHVLGLSRRARMPPTIGAGP